MNNFFRIMVRPVRFELTAFCSGGKRKRNESAHVEQNTRGRHGSAKQLKPVVRDVVQRHASLPCLAKAKVLQTFSGVALHTVKTHCSARKSSLGPDSVRVVCK